MIPLRRALLLPFLLIPAARAAPPAIAAIETAMRKSVESREIAGAVTLVADADELRHLSAVGMADIAAEKPMPTDAIFWIASMTEPVTATAAAMLAEEGKFAWDDPVSKYLPEFTGDKAGITIAQCLSHTSGLSDVPREETKAISTLAELMPLVAAKPLRFKPGSKWEYCQSGINAIGRLIEVASGKSYPDFLQERLFDPLGMKDTGFYPGPEAVARLAKSYRKSADGGLEEADLYLLNGKSLSDKSRCPMANGGLFSTAADYGKFAQMILRGGERGGKRYLSEESVRHMTAPATGDLQVGFTPGNAWALGWCVTREPQGASAALSPGSSGHGGAFGTQAWIDPVKKRIYLLLVQRADFPNSDASDVRRDFQNAAAAGP